ncbi:hypothetical protein Tco_0766488 [Tanacetum coccineum]
MNCTSNGTVLIGEFPLQQINKDTLLLIFPAKCGRGFEALGKLYSEHYAVMSTSAFFMENGMNLMSRDCIIARSSMFLDYGNSTKMGCRFLFSGVVNNDTEAVPLHNQMVESGWWVKGSCDCSDGADCTQIVSPIDGSDGH